jgi:hypothetical protein
MPATIDADTHRFNYVTGNSAATRTAGMIGGGPVAISTDHWLAEVGKDWLPAPVNGRIIVDYHLLEWLFIEAFLLDNLVMALGQGWFLGLPLLSQFQAELCWVKIPADGLDKKKTRELITMWAKANLSDALRKVSPQHLVQSAITSGDWHAAATNKMVAGPNSSEGPNQDLSVLRQFRMLCAGGYNPADQASPYFIGLVDMVEIAIGKDLTGKTPPAICSHAIAWVRQTRPLPEFDEYVLYEDAAGEIAALSPGGQNAQVEIFKHRYVRSWRQVFPNLGSAFPTAVSGEEAYDLAETLAAKFKLATPLSRSSAAALELSLGRILPALDTDALKLKSNSDRLAAFAEGDLDSASVRSGGGGTGQNANGGDSLHRMYMDADYMNLQSLMEVLAVPGYNVSAAFLTMTKHCHGFGIIFANGKKMLTHPVWGFFSGLQAESVAREVLLELLQVDKMNVEHKEWVLNIHPDVAKKLLTGRFAMGDGKSANSIHYFSQIIAPCLEKREGFHILARYQQYMKGDPAAMLLDSQLMRLAEPVLSTCFDFIGHTGKTPLTFRALIRGLIDRAQVLETMPPNLGAVKVLRVKLVQVGTLSFASAADDMQTMCSSSLGVIARPTGFFRDGSRGAVALAAYDILVTETLVDLERAVLGMGRIPGMPGASSLVDQLMLEPNDPASTVVVVGKKRKAKEEAWAAQYQGFDTTVHGSMTKWHGIFLGPEGYCYGWHTTSLRNGVTQNITGVCPGQLALSTDPDKRDAWHVAGHNCVKGHPRPGRLVDDDIIAVTTTTADQRGKMKVIVEPSPDNKRGPYATSTDKGGRGKGGKGKGKGGGKGKSGGKGGKSLNKRQR